MNRILRYALALVHTVVEFACIEDDGIVIGVRPWKRHGLRCPVCGRACECYDARREPRRWRAQDIARSECFLEYAVRRVRCPEHGVHVESVPWARPRSRFTRDFEDWVAWLAVHCTTSTVAELARVEWRSVGGICGRVYADLEARRGGGRFGGVRRIGIDELWQASHNSSIPIPAPFPNLFYNLYEYNDRCTDKYRNIYHYISGSCLEQIIKYHYTNE